MRPTGSPSSRQPSSKEKTFRRSRSAAIRCIANIAISRTICSPTRSACEYSERARARLGRRQVADRQVGDLAVADRRQLHVGVGEAELGEPGAGVDLERLGDLRVGLVALAQRADDLQAGRRRRARAARGRRRRPPPSPRLARRGRAAGRAGRRPRRPGAGARARRAADRACRAAPGRGAARSTRRAGRPRRAGGSDGRPWGRSRSRARRAGTPRT